MATFGQVFSVTWKVVLALVILGAAISIVFGIINGIGSSVSTTKTENHTIDYRAQAADEQPTTMPASKWKLEVAKATKKHCVIPGMTKEEVLASAGEPAKRTEFKSADLGDDWTYEHEEKDCARYSGDTCVEHTKTSNMLFFSPKGHLEGPALLAPYCDQ